MREEPLAPLAWEAPYNRWIFKMLFDILGAHKEDNTFKAVFDKVLSARTKSARCLWATGGVC